MYRINQLSRPVLITIDEVITKAVVDENADLRYLKNSIEVAEERFIAPALGDAFYEDFISKKNVIVAAGNRDALLASINASLAANNKAAIDGSKLVNGMMVNAIELCPANYQALWNRFLWKICAEATDALSVVPSWLRSTAQGQEHNNPKSLNSEGAASGDRKDVELKLDNMYQQRIYPLISKMKKWIVENGSFTLYPDNKRKEDGINTQLKGGIIFGAYEDKNPNGPNMWDTTWGRGRRYRDDEF